MPDSEQRVPPAIADRLAHPHHHHVTGGGRQEVHQRDLETADRVDSERRRIEMIRNHVLMERRLKDVKEDIPGERRRIGHLAPEQADVRPEIVAEHATEVGERRHQPQRGERHGAQQEALDARLEQHGYHEERRAKDVGHAVGR